MSTCARLAALTLTLKTLPSFATALRSGSDSAFAGEQVADFDVVIVGGGVVGLACAASLACDRRTLIVLERHERWGEEGSSRNSGVIHAGLYYPVGSLKALTCF
jgi:FAD dependent oxidoreductase